MSLDEFLARGDLIEKYMIWEEPALESVVNIIREKWRSYVIIIFAYSRVEYSGRASSTLDWNDHLIIIKPDGTLLIHGETKREPINWQPPGSTITSYLQEGLLIIRSRRYKPREIVLVKIKRIYFIATALMKSGRFNLFGTEADMVQYVYENPSFIEEGFKPIAREYRGRYGIIDLLGRDKQGNLVVCEFKRRIADVQDVAQLALYVDSLRRDLGKNVRGILIAPGITDIAMLALKEKNLEFKKFALELQKIKSKQKFGEN